MPVAPDLAGSALDNRYELHAIIGEGAFGRVYRGFDRRLERPVAVKVIKPWWAEDRPWVERFRREARLLARVSDPGIVQVFDLGYCEDGPFYVAELVEGESLAELLRGDPLPPGTARHVAEQLCRALGSAHAQGVVHCDVKPGNVLLTTDDTVKVGDFGLARLGEATSQNLSATIAGTPRYMSPEQAEGRPPTPATDVYSAGVVLYEMLVGEPPFTGGSGVQLAIRHMQEQPPALPTGVPADLRAIVKKALAKRPGARYRDGAEMAAALRQADAGALAPHAPASLAGTNLTARTDRKNLAPEAAATEVVVRDAATVPLAAATPVAKEAVRTARHPPRDREHSSPTHVLPAAGRRARRQTRSYKRGRVALLAGVAVLALGALAVLVFGGAASPTTVPELRGLPRGGVIARAQRMHVLPVFARRHSTTASAGLAIAQSPAPGARIGAGSTVSVVLSAGPPPVTVPDVVGQGSVAAEGVLVGTGLRYAVTPVAAPGSRSNTVLGESPTAAVSVPHGSTVALTVAETPRWRALATFSGEDSGSSVPFRIKGSQWRVRYGMQYAGTCLLLVYCMGPSAHAQNVQTGASFGDFELGEGESQEHVFHSGPGLYSIAVSSGRDSARWSMTVEDYY